MGGIWSVRLRVCGRKHVQQEGRARVDVLSVDPSTVRALCTVTAPALPISVTVR